MTTITQDDTRHGSWAGYGAGCRQECCRKAARQYQKIRNHEANHGKPRTVPALGTKRRLQALAALGWDFYSIATEAGQHREWVWQIYRRDTVHTRTAQKIQAVFEHLCMTRPEGWVADRARRQAAARGWAPPLAWDDIDNPAERPKGTGAPIREPIRCGTRRGYERHLYRKEATCEECRKYLREARRAQRKAAA